MVAAATTELINDFLEKEIMFVFDASQSYGFQCRSTKPKLDNETFK